MEEKSKRYHEMDAIRAIAMWLGVVLHSSISYNVKAVRAWPQDEMYQAYFYDFLYQWVHAFRMPLFFLIAGFFARLLLLKIGSKKFIKHRLKRILLPFAVSLIVIVPLSSLPFKYFVLLQEGIAKSVAIQQSLLDIFSWNGLFHLWFLYYLMVYYIISILARELTAKNNVVNRLLSFKIHFNAYEVLLLAGLTLAIIHFLYGTSLPVYTGVRLHPGQFFYYGLFFMVGYSVHRSPQVLEKIPKLTWPALLAGTALSLFIIANKFLDLLTNDLIIESLITLEIILLVIGFLGFFILFFQRESRTIRFISDSSYWFYLCHFPIVVFLQIGMFSSAIPGFLKFFIVLIVTTAISMITYLLFVRYTVIGTILNGKRTLNKRRFHKLVGLKTR